MEKESSLENSRNSLINEFDDSTLSNRYTHSWDTRVPIKFYYIYFAGVGFFLFGYDQSLIGSLLTLPNFEETFPSILGPHNGVLQGTVVSIYEIGCFAGAIATIYCGNKFGAYQVYAYWVYHYNHRSCPPS